MKNASEIIVALKQGEGLLYSFAKNAQGTPTNFSGYDVAKVAQIWDFIKSQNYFDGVSAYDRDQATSFRRLIAGTPLQTESQRQTDVNATIARMDSDTLAKFAAFVHRAERTKTGYLADRIADGSMQTLVARIGEIGPRVEGQKNYPGSAFAAKAPALVA